MNNSRMPTLEQRLEEWKHRASRRIRVDASDPDTGERKNVEAPEWLFRGESKIYPGTFSSRHRFDRNNLSEQARAEVDAVARRLDAVLRKRGLSGMYSAALLQHYGLPSEWIDLTASLEVAGAFAAYKCRGSGVLMAFPTRNLFEQGILVELTQIHFARRPRYQSAYGYFHRREPNLKAVDLFSVLQAERVEFDGDPVELRRWNDYHEEICGAPHTDPTSGLLHKLIEDEVLAHPEPGKRYSLCAEAREWLEERIPWAPIPMRPVPDSPGELEPDWDKF